MKELNLSLNAHLEAIDVSDVESKFHVVLDPNQNGILLLFSYRTLVDNLLE